VMKIQVVAFCVVTPCSYLVGYQGFGGPHCLHLHGEVSGTWYRRGSIWGMRVPFGPTGSGGVKVSFSGPYWQYKRALSLCLHQKEAGEDRDLFRSTRGCQGKKHNGKKAWNLVSTCDTVDDKFGTTAWHFFYIPLHSSVPFNVEY